MFLFQDDSISMQLSCDQGNENLSEEIGEARHEGTFDEGMFDAGKASLVRYSTPLFGGPTLDTKMEINEINLEAEIK